ncbi:MAG: hypothetical protein HN531_00440 [Opitutae bacterium]|nr:hypothetical protein [Opitutae bacterium]
MPKELIFTSVPSGIEPGSSGYCTIAKHKGIDRILSRALEGVSFYEMMNLADKPVVHAYRILNLNTGTFYALTRICFSGSDHTGRTNYLAHSLVFAKEEIPPGVTPAEIFLHGEGWLSGWPKDAPPAFFTEGSLKVKIPPPSDTHASLRTWQKHTGAGSLAHELLPRGRWKFFTQKGAHADTLSIIAEATALPDGPSKQVAWGRITFTTFLQPADKTDNFMIAAGDGNSPALANLSRNALRLGDTPDPGACFCPMGGSAYGSLPGENKPVTQAQAPATEVPAVENTFEAAPEQPSIEVAPHDPFATEPVEEQVQQAEPVVSNLNLDAGNQSPAQAPAQTDFVPTPQPIEGSDLSALSDEKPGRSIFRWILFGALGLIAVGCLVALFVIRPWVPPPKKDIVYAANQNSEEEPETDPSQQNDVVQKDGNDSDERVKSGDSNASTPPNTEPDVKLEVKKPVVPASVPALPETYTFPIELLTKPKDDCELHFDIGDEKGVPYVWDGNKTVPKTEFSHGSILFYLLPQGDEKRGFNYTITIPENSPSTMILSNAKLSKKVSKENLNWEKLKVKDWEFHSAGDQKMKDVTSSYNAVRDTLISYLGNKQNSYYFKTLKGNFTYIEGLLLDDKEKYDGTTEPLEILIEKIPLWVEAIQHGDAHFKEFADKLREFKDRTVTNFEKQKDADKVAETNQDTFKTLTGKTVKEAASNATELHKSFQQKLKNLSSDDRQVEFQKNKNTKKVEDFLTGGVTNYTLKNHFILVKPLSETEMKKSPKSRRKPAECRKKFIQEANRHIKNAKDAWVGRFAYGKYTKAKHEDVESLKELSAKFEEANKVFQANKLMAENIDPFPKSYRKEDKTLIEIRRE